MRRSFLAPLGGGHVSIARPPPPYPARPLANVDVIGILIALKVAWAIMERDGAPHGAGAPVRWHEENAVTGSLGETLNLLLSGGELDFFASARFETVVVDAVLRNHDGTKPVKKPDLTFRVRGDAGKVHGGERGLFVEAKVLDGVNRHVSHYVRDGIRRYVEGEYAWAMPHGLMLAYVLNEQVLPDALNEQLFPPAEAVIPACTPLGPACVPGYLAGVPDVQDVHCTIHGRDFIVRGVAASDIEILHLWLRCPRG